MLAHSILSQCVSGTGRLSFNVVTMWGFVQLKEEEERIEESEAETRKKMKATKEHTKKWEETRENRVLLVFSKSSTSAAII